ncbi:MAG TPA: FAD-dependent oxidoreductase [Myxococcales bacterium]|nr:FAD-dependent oxidoreductase [Myxococcales bacterium]
MDPEVLVVGAGPTGLLLALWLSRSGVRLRIIDKAEQPGGTSRAVVSRRARSSSIGSSASPTRW